MVVVIFKESSAMEGAYGLAITVNMLMTTSLLVYYFMTAKKSLYRSILLGAVFFTLEGAFLVSNLHKFEHGGWFTFLIAFVFLFLMFVLYKARKLRQRHTEFVDLRHYESMLKDLQEDDSIPKEASNLVYLSVADSRRYIDSNIIYSIFKKRPKRADVYWFVHVETVTIHLQVSIKLIPSFPNVPSSSACGLALKHHTGSIRCSTRSFTRWRIMEKLI